MTLSPSDPRVQDLLNGLADPDLSKVMMKRTEPLRVPHYKLLTLKELEQVCLFQITCRAWRIDASNPASLYPFVY